MLRAMTVAIISVLISASFPILLQAPLQTIESDNRLLLIETRENDKGSQTDLDSVELLTSGEILSLPVEEYLVGVLVSEMPMSFNDEALKAQAIAARTFVFKKISDGKHSGFDVCDQSSCCQAWNSMHIFRERFGSNYDTYIKKAVQAVQETSGMMIYYENELIDAPYFSCSGGRTEDAVAVWGSDIPYLKTVDSPGEENASNYHSVVSIASDEFCRCLERTDLTGNPELWLGDIVLSEGGGVLSIEIGNKYYSGTDLRRIFGLKSTLFSISTEPDRIIFDVKGYGHRVGMSQYGANVLAEAGYEYEEILKHYYQGVEIK